MSEEVKFELVFGDQSLFYGAPEDAVSVRYGKSEYIFDSEEIKATIGQLRDVPVVAMRRIIKVPVWKKADQLAGKLPEVGAEVMCMDDSRHNFVGESIHAEHWALCHGKTKKVFHIPATAVRPVETDTERQQRLKEEWCHSALKLINDELTDACDAAVIYDALLSGELQAPKGE